MPGVLTRIASALICSYIRHFPVEKGKWRVLTCASPFLVVEVESNTFLRVSTSPFDSVAVGIARKGILEPKDVQVFLGFLEPGMIVFDVGANIGMYTVLAARRVGPTGGVHAFEPTPQVAARVKENAAINGLSNVAVNQKAVAAVEGSALFYLQDGSDQNTLAPCTGRTIEVQTVTLDAYVSAAGVTEVDVVKMDVEGAEVMALQGGKQFFSRDASPMLMLEVNPKALEAMGASAQQLGDLLAAYGYCCYRLQSYGTGSDAYSNVLAMKPAHRSRFRIPFSSRELSSLRM